MLANVLEPIYTLMGYILAGFYAVVPNYGLAIMGTTLVVLIVLTPLTLKQIRQGIRIQKLQPELKRIQDDYKDDMVAKNEAVMALYKEHNANPVSCILPMLVQFPFFIALNGTLHGLSSTRFSSGDNVKITGVKTIAAAAEKAKVPVGDIVWSGTPKHLPTGSSLFKSLSGTRESLGHDPGQMKAFGMDLAKAAKDVTGFSNLLPYIIIIAISILAGVYAQMQMTKRNPAAAVANPQQQQMAKIMPFLFGIWGYIFQGGLAVYFTTSSVLRILQQALLYRFDPTLTESVRENRQKAIDEGIIEAKTKRTTVKDARPAAKPGATSKPAAKPNNAKPGAAGSKPGGGQLQPATGAAAAGTTRTTGRQQPKKKRKGR